MCCGLLGNAAVAVHWGMAVVSCLFHGGNAHSALRSYGRLRACCLMPCCGMFMSKCIGIAIRAKQGFPVPVLAVALAWQVI